MPEAISDGLILKLEEILVKAKEEKDWFDAIVLCAIQLERFGYRSLKDYFDAQKIKPDLTKKILYRISLGKIADYLRIIGIISDDEFGVIKSLNKERNEFVHRKEGYRYLIGTAANKKYEPLIVESIRILKEKLNAIRFHVSQ